MDSPAQQNSLPDAIEDTSSETKVNPITEPKYVELPSGMALDAKESLVITCEYPTQLIVLAGGEASGKTTMLASIYESFNEGPFAGYVFAGSRSLIGFEQISYLNRLPSGLHVPETERTNPSEPVLFYHLSLRNDIGMKIARYDVLFAAVSGELFRLARDSIEGATELTFIKRADVLAILVDGAKLADIKTREQVLVEADTLLRSFLDAGMLSHRTRIEFVFSKYDCIQAGNAEQFVNERATKRLISAFQERIPTLHFRRVAARPMESNLEFAYGLSEALKDWLLTENDTRTIFSQGLETSDSEREFAQYGWRYLKRQDLR